MLQQSNLIVLLVEDDPLIALDVTDELERAGFVVWSFSARERARHWLADNTPDVAVLDVTLDDGGADDLAKLLVDADVPFIVYSGQLPSQMAGTWFAKGRWITKPSSAFEIADTAFELLADR